MPIPQFQDTSIIDSDQFEMLIETGEDEAAQMLQELLDLFVDETGRKLPELEQAAREGDRHRCNRIAHAIAGSSANLGGLRLSSFARAYEAAAATALQDDLIQDARSMKLLYDETVAAIQSEIQKL